MKIYQAFQPSESTKESNKYMIVIRHQSSYRFLVMLAFILLTLGSCSVKDDKATDQKKDDFVANIPPITYEDRPDYRPNATVAIGADGLYAAYFNNEIAADKKYKDIIVHVSGFVGSIAKVNDNTTGIIVWNSYEQYQVFCYFNSRENDNIAKLTKGQQVDIVGMCTGIDRTSGVPKLYECYIKEI